MPVYVYKNLKTGELFEVTQSMRDPAYSVHPETGEPVKRIIQPVGISFKGSGFYVNDSRKASNGNGAGHKSHAGGTAESSDGASAKGSSASGSDAKTSAASSTSSTPSQGSVTTDARAAGKSEGAKSSSGASDRA